MNSNNSHIDHSLLMQFLLGEATISEQQKVKDWLSLSSENQAYLDKLEAIWAESGKLTPPPVAVDVKSAWDKMSNRIDEEENNKTVSIEDPKIRKINTFGILLRVAAVFVVAFTMFKVYQVINKPGTQQIVSSIEVVNDILPDGSAIVLNTNSTLSYPKKFNKKEREVELEGEAFFEVAHNAEKPFVIHAGIGSIRVLGTSFIVKAYPDSDLVVIVETGLVELFKLDELTGDTTIILLEAGTKGKISKNKEELEKVHEVDPDDSFWLNRKLIFKETELCTVFQLLEEYYDIVISVNNDSINYCMLSASFDDNAIEEILEVIAVSFDLVIIKEKNTYLFEVNNGTDETK